MTARFSPPRTWSLNDRHEPEDEEPLFQEDVNRMLNSFSPVPPGQTEGKLPRFDITEKGNEFCVDAELPGLEEKDIRISLWSGMLIIEAEHDDSKGIDEPNCHVVKRSHLRFAHKVQIPFAADSRSLISRYSNGVLHIVVQKPATASTSSLKPFA